MYFYFFNDDDNKSNHLGARGGARCFIVSFGLHKNIQNYILFFSEDTGVLGLKKLSKFSQNYEMEEKEHRESAK